MVANVNEMLAQELNKPVIKYFKRTKVYARLRDYIWAADLDKMRSLSSLRVRVSLCFIDAFTKYFWVKPLINTNAKTVL